MMLLLSWHTIWWGIRYTILRLLIDLQSTFGFQRVTSTDWWHCQQRTQILMIRSVLFHQDAMVSVKTSLFRSTTPSEPLRFKFKLAAKLPVIYIFLWTSWLHFICRYNKKLFPLWCLMGNFLYFKNQTEQFMCY